MGEEKGGVWMVDPPPAPDEFRVRVQFGENVQATPEIKEALEHLAKAIDESQLSEVSGYSFQAFQAFSALPQGAFQRPGGLAADCSFNICGSNRGFALTPTEISQLGG